MLKFYERKLQDCFCLPQMSFKIMFQNSDLRLTQKMAYGVVPQHQKKKKNPSLLNAIYRHRVEVQFCSDVIASL